MNENTSSGLPSPLYSNQPVSSENVEESHFPIGGSIIQTREPLSSSAGSKKNSLTGMGPTKLSSPASRGSIVQVHQHPPAVGLSPTDSIIQMGKSTRPLNASGEITTPHLCTQRENFMSEAVEDEEGVRKTESARESSTSSSSEQIGNVSWGVAIPSGTGGAADPLREGNSCEFKKEAFSQSQPVSTPDFDMGTGDPFGLQAISNVLPSPPAAASSPIYGLKRPTDLLQLNKNDNPQDLLAHPLSATSAPSWHTHPVECLDPSQPPPLPPDFVTGSSAMAQDDKQLSAMLAVFSSNPAEMTQQQPISSRTVEEEQVFSSVSPFETARKQATIIAPQGIAVPSPAIESHNTPPPIIEATSIASDSEHVTRLSSDGTSNKLQPEASIDSTPSLTVQRRRKQQHSTEEGPLEELVDQFMQGSEAKPCPISWGLPTEDLSASDIHRMSRGRAWKSVLKCATYLIMKGGTASPVASTSEIDGAPKIRENVVELRLCRIVALIRLGRSQEAIFDLEETVCEARLSSSPVRFAVHVLATDIIRESEGANACGDALEILLGALEGYISWIREQENCNENQEDTATHCSMVYKPEVNGSILNTGLELGLCMSLGMAQLWWRRICIMLVNNFIERGKATSALRLLCRLEEVGAEEETSPRTSIEVSSRIGFVLLQMGDVRNASDFFERANTILAQSKNLLCNERKIFTSKARINDGLIYLAVDDFPAAIASFDEALDELNGVSPGYSSDMWEVPAEKALGWSLDAHPFPAVAATNNLAVAKLYMCDMQGAIHTLENLVRSNPCMGLRDCTAFNLCTLYDLTCDAKGSTLKKCILLGVASRYQLQDLPRSSFRLGKKENASK